MKEINNSSVPNVKKNIYIISISMDHPSSSKTVEKQRICVEQNFFV